MNGQLYLRAQRLNIIGDGRVYVITFQADDGHGGSCTGKTRVGVPFKRQSRTIIDSGQLYDSFAP